MYPYGGKEWKVNRINKPGGEKRMSGILKATSNGLRPQSFARRAVIKVSCSSNIVSSVVFCTTLKSNGKSSGNLWVYQRQKELNNSLPVNNRKFH